MGDRFKICTTCGQRRNYDQFGLAANRTGRQKNCHDCVLELLKNNGTLENYIKDQPVFHHRTRKGAFQDQLYFRQKGIIKHRKIKQDKKAFYAKKKADSIRKFDEMFPKSNY